MRHQFLRLSLLIQLVCNIGSMSTSSATPQKKIAVIGATGGLGRQAVKILSSRGIPSKLLLRQPLPPDSTTPLPTTPLLKTTPKDQVAKYFSSLPNVEIVYGDVTDPKSLLELLNGCDACLSLHGAKRISKLSDLWADASDTDPTHSKQVNYVGVLNLIEAARQSKSCRRIVRITGKGESPSSPFTVLLNALGSMAKAWNYQGELALRSQAHVDYTIIRPGIMDDDGPTGKVLVLADDGADLPVGRVRYEDIAELCCDCLDYPNAARSTLTAMSVGEEGGDGEGGGGSESYGELLEGVGEDRRSFPVDMLDRHRRAVRNFVLWGFAVVFALLGVLVRVLVG